MVFSKWSRRLAIRRQQQKRKMEQGVEVVESGRSLRVQTDTPHLVSLGTGRLSTAVTLHPLTPGRITIGSEQDVDIPLQGAGVEPVHCHIENIAGVVTLYPVADMTTVDGLKVTSPTRLTQGCMLCIGRSNYFRFNHPAEARLMKSILPTTRISTEAPGHLERKPPPAPRSRCSPRDSWEGDDCCVLGKVSRFELLAHQHLSPKVFPAGSPTANSPASAVLGPARSSPLYHGNVVLQNGALRSRSATPTSAVNGSCQSPVQTASTPRLSTPSPSFNRNPLPYSGSSAFRSVTPSPTPQSSSHRRVLSSGGGSDSLSCCSGGSLEELCSRSDELEMRRKQAQEARLREQEAEKQERARLEEILNMCAEYEMQAQSERQAATPHTPTLQQNRIKTNGSLPRDKRLLSPSAHDDDMAEVFTFETTSTSVVGSFSVNYSPVSGVMQHSASEDTNKTASSGMMRSPYENVMIPAPGTVLHPQSPRTRIRTIAPSVKDTNESVESRHTTNSDYEFMDSLSSNKKQENGFAPDVKKPLNDGGGKFILPLENNSPESLNDGINSIVISKLSVDVPDSKINGSVSDKNTVPCDSTSEVSQQPRQKNAGELELVRRERGKLLASLSGLKRKIADIELQQEEILRELDMERALLEGEWQAQRDKLLQEEERLSALREKVAGLDIEMEEQRHQEQQRQNEAKWRLERAEREVYRLEQELSAYLGNSEKQRELSESLKQQTELLEAERKAFEDLEFRQLEEEAGWLAGREELQRELVELTARVEVRNMRLSELEHQRGEAARVAQEENRSMQRQLITYLHRLEEGRQRLKVLDNQLSELTSGQTEPISGQDSSQDGSSDNDEVTRSTSLQQSSSQDDLDRISRVTSGAPMEMSSGTLGRRTLESLQEIERNRQRHLVQQGSQVIEEERKRVQELKRRVQDEVRAQWEERRQREANCNSLNSVGSEDSSLTSSDIPTESASSDDALLSPNKTDVTARSDTTENKTESVPNNCNNVQDKMREKELAAERDREETRPLSDGSAYEHQLSAPVRKRDKCSPRPQEPSQRPLTRYLPIRSESLNLRQHVESAGHQVELCKDVSLDATSCRGHLHKMGSKFHHWNKRWFVFDRMRRTLTYYSDRGEKKPRGGAYFQSIEEVYVDHLNSVKSPNPQLTFVVKTNERTYHLMAPSPEAMRIWVDVIFTGAEGYQEFEHGS